jgi:hypothetical protein
MNEAAHMNTLWIFHTENFTIRLTAYPEDTDPTDEFDSIDVVDDIREGRVEWFEARVTVEWDGAIVGSDSLGCCCYGSYREFYAGHRDRNPMHRNYTIFRAVNPNASICHYFPDMVREAVIEARRMLGNVPRLRAA